MDLPGYDEWKTRLPVPEEFDDPGTDEPELEPEIWTTKCQTENGRVFDLGKGEHPPRHEEHLVACPACNVVNAWTERRSHVPEDRG